MAGKDEAKKNVSDKNKWYNAVDYWTCRSKNGETHGVLIGPHTSNILSEIILCRVDKELTPKYDYIRNIDDYTCYVSSRDEAERFLVDLNAELEKYDLSLNHKKTEIVELPVGAVEQWVSRLEDRFSTFGQFKEYVDYKEVRALIDYCILLMGQNQENSSILLYAMKTLSGKDETGTNKYKLSNNAKVYCVQRMSALALLYPYIVPWLDEYVFSQFDASIENIEKITKKIYKSNMQRKNYESCAYSLYFASKYGFCLDSVFDLTEVIKSNDCILMLMSLIYCRKIKWRGGVDILRKHANSLMQMYMNEYWIFIYECLNGSLSGNWKELKKAKVSFLKSEFQT